MDRELIIKITDWADRVGISENGTIYGQIEKTKEEVEELYQGILKDDLLEIKDAIGDTFVTLVTGLYLNFDLNKVETTKIILEKLKDAEQKRAPMGATISYFISCLKGTVILLESFINLENTYKSWLVFEVIMHLHYIASEYDLTLEECVKHAYEQIKDRTGKTVDGQFIKDAN